MRTTRNPTAPSARDGARGRLAALVAGTLAIAVAAVVSPPYLVRVFVGPPPHWHAGKPAATLPAVLEPAGGQAPAPTAAGVAAAVAPQVAAAGLGDHTSVAVVDVGTGQSLYAAAADSPTVPASTTKIITAVTVLAARGPGYRLATRVVAGGSPGEVILVGGGDPTLAGGADGSYPGAARLDELAGQVRKALGTTPVTRVLYDATLFTGDQYAQSWDSDVTTGGYGAPVSALTMNGARNDPDVDPYATQQPPRQQHPDQEAAQSFATALGVPASAVSAGTAGQGARELGRVESPPVSRLVEMMLTASDNVLAESLARQVAIARGQPATFAGAATAMKAVLDDLGLPTTGYGLADGSGLARTGRLTAALLTGALALAARPDRPQLRAVFAGLPVAGYSGTLTKRYRVAGTATAAGYVRAKTGTLSGVHALSGIVVDADGRLLAFAVLADSVTKAGSAAQEGLDRIAATLAACGCR